MKRDIKLFIEDILENIGLIEDSIKGKNKKDFEDDRMLFDATMRRLEIIGEAVKNIPSSFRNKYPNVPWKKIAGLRDILSHVYFGLDSEIIWNIIKKDVPKLEKQIKRIKKDSEKNK